MRTNIVIRLSLLSAAVLCLTSCGTEENYKIAMNSWHGAPVTALVHSWGEPEDVDHLANGNEVYVYRVNEQASALKVYPQNTGRLSTQPAATIMHSPPSGISTGSYSFSCETRFEINHNGMIVNTAFDGNNCVSTKDSAKRWAY